MREIKIQFILKDECIGNKVFGKLTYSLDEILEGITNEYICEKACESFSPANGVEADFEIIAKRQSTGLQDKNKDDIYEGDIIKITTESNSWISKVGNHGIWHEIIVNDSDLDIDFVSINYAYDALDCEIEVIGNIYENPELLESEK